MSCFSHIFTPSLPPTPSHFSSQFAILPIEAVRCQLEDNNRDRSLLFFILVMFSLKPATLKVLQVFF